MTYENEQREEHERELDNRVMDHVQDAIAYSERENSNLHRTVERLERENSALVVALDVFFKVVVVDGKQYRPGYPFCEGCDELTIARGWECFYKIQTTECKYPDSLKAKALALAEATNE